jgi:hypothetical protein
MDGLGIEERGKLESIGRLPREEKMDSSFRWNDGFAWIPDRAHIRVLSGTNWCIFTMGPGSGAHPCAVRDELILF